MCGIAGILGHPDKARLSAMLAITRHRGPDDSGIYADDYAALGMNRLAIIDLSSAGHQPMFSEDGRYLIVYNGECYNFPELRRELEKCGHSFSSHTDTEVILKAYLEYGEKCLKRLRGMFAFVIYDTHTHRVFGARDRLGIKPLYYHCQDGRFVFASEIKALLRSGQVDFQLDPTAVWHYFTFGFIQQPATILQGVQALMPGHFFTLNPDEDLRIQPYWTLEIDETAAQLPYEAAKEKIYALIDEAVRIRLISDRPLGLFLSGGLDSAVVLHHMARHSDKVTTFSVGFEQNAYARDEREEAAVVARHVGAGHESILIDGADVAADFDHFIQALDQPSVDGLNTYIVSKYAAQRMTVALSGLGGDELFAGYSRHANICWKYRHNRGWRDGIARYLLGNPQLLDATWGTAAGDFLLKLRSYWTARDVRYNYLVSRTGAYPSALRQLLGQGGAEAFTRREYLDLYRDIDRSPSPRDELQRVTALDLFTFMSSQLLRDMDAVSMAHSMEVRFPLIDHRLLELVYSLPASFKLRLGRSKPGWEGSASYEESGAKYILQDIYRAHLPTGFLSRRKNGFKLPVQQWLAEQLAERTNDTITRFHQGNIHLNGLTQADPWKALIFGTWVEKARQQTGGFSYAHPDRS